MAWTRDVPIAQAFDDPYFSLADGLAETRHVFLDGNDLPARFEPGFHVAELGFGTGLNVLAVWAAWRGSGCGGALTVTSFERFPLARDAMARAHRAYPELAKLSARLLDGLTDAGFEDESLRLSLEIGDARETLPRWNGTADAWFLDGFSPAKNPELWEPSLMAAVAEHTRPGGTAATYSAAGAVRRGMADAGFAVERVAGYGRKRHMTRARLR
ncbi:MAG: tRNA (5-methylaminomethyl-2-thiouridine)(34)-methyltransferase MnmD [Paracoccaceae bacterium]